MLDSPSNNLATMVSVQDQLEVFNQLNYPSYLTGIPSLMEIRNLYISKFRTMQNFSVPVYLLT